MLKENLGKGPVAGPAGFVKRTLVVLYNIDIILHRVSKKIRLGFHTKANDTRETSYEPILNTKTFLCHLKQPRYSSLNFKFQM